MKIRISETSGYETDSIEPEGNRQYRWKISNDESVQTYVPRTCDVFNIVNDVYSLIFPGLYYVELSVTFYTESIFRRTKRTSAKTMLQLKDILFRESVV